MVNSGMKLKITGIEFNFESDQFELLIFKLNNLIEGKDLIMATLDEILANVTAQATRIDSLNTLMDGIRQQLADALSGAVIPADVQRKIDAVFAAAQVNAAKIEEAIRENTPGGTTPPDEV